MKAPFYQQWPANALLSTLTGVCTVLAAHCVQFRKSSEGERVFGSGILHIPQNNPHIVQGYILHQAIYNIYDQSIILEFKSIQAYEH